MAGATGTPENIQDNSFNLSGISDLIKYFGGAKTEGGGTAQTMGEIGPLLALFSQSMDPNNLLNLVQNLFAQGAAKVPELTTQFSNATGTRYTNNTMLAGSLAQLNQGLAQAIAQSIVQQQAQVAVPAAQQIAKSNTATSETKKQTTEAGSGASDKLFGTILAGVIANKLGKEGVLGGVKKAGDTGGATAANAGVPPVTSGPVIPSSYDNPAGVGSVDQGFTFSTPPQNAGAVQDFGNASPLVASAGPTVYPDSGEVDTGAVSDEGESAFWAAGGGDTAFDVGSADFDFANEGLAYLFKDGGLVSRKTGKAMRYRKAAAYADGGEVSASPEQRRNVPNFGPRLLPQLTQAQTFRLGQEAEPVLTPSQTERPFAAGVGRNRNVIDPTTGLLDKGDVAAFDLSNELGQTQTGPLEASVSPAQVGMLGLSALTAPTLAAFVAAAFPGMITSVITKGVTQALTGMVSPDDPAAVGIAAMDQAMAPQGFVTSDAMAAEVEDGSPADLGEAFGGMGQGDAGSSFGPGGSDGNADGGFGGFGGIEGGFGGEGGAAGGEGGGDGFAAGGYAKAKTPSQKGTDRIPAYLTEGEFVLPVDVVKALGVDNLQEVVDLFHVPA